MGKQVAKRRKQYKRITLADKEKFFEGLRAGLTVREASTQSGHPPETYYDLARSDPTFGAAKTMAQNIGTDRLEEEARRRGMEGYEAPVWGKVAPGIDGQVGVETRYSDRLLEIMLKGRRPEYRDNPRVDITNQTLNVTLEDRSAALKDVAAVLAEAGVDYAEIEDGSGGPGKELPGPPSLLAESSEL